MIVPVIGQWAVYRNGRARWGGEPYFLSGEIVSVTECGYQFRVRPTGDDSGRVWTRDLLSLHKTERTAQRALRKLFGTEAPPPVSGGTMLLGGRT